MWTPPAAIAVTPEPKPTTSTGVGREVLVPSPSWPKALYPQHLTPPLIVSAQMWCQPAAMAVTPELKPTTSTGVVQLVVVPSPSAPESLNPQHLTPPLSAHVWYTPAGAMIERIVHRTRKSMLRWLGRKGYLVDKESAADEEPDGLERCQQMALHYGQLVGLPSPTSKSDHGRFELRSHRHYHGRTEDGFDLDASVVIEQGDDEGRERLVRYCARPAVVLEHLSKLPDGKYSYRTKYTRNGRTHRLMTGTELCAPICALLPPPRYPLVRYSGVFASAHTWRPLVVPKPPPPRTVRGCKPSNADETKPAPTTATTADEPLANEPFAERSELRSPFILADPHLRRLLDGLLLMKSPRADWASLLRRSHGLDVLDCPSCHGRLRLLGVVKDKSEARRFLQHLGRPSEPPPIASAPDPTLDALA